MKIYNKKIVIFLLKASMLLIVAVFFIWCLSLPLLLSIILMGLTIIGGMLYFIVNVRDFSYEFYGAVISIASYNPILKFSILKIEFPMEKLKGYKLEHHFLGTVLKLHVKFNHKDNLIYIRHLIIPGLKTQMENKLRKSLDEIIKTNLEE
ncbi:hypothetical protein MUU74_08040 [Chryseobacterium daecheongense]|uniref:hypothetical protein n=1 Tax=Chryseobacterium daecheongense TaxID=192389 RepID=UPI001FD68767|nr:hypothetical protein [Chryseobacterium daecheongense]UOU99891.1 hypothetical protein MUU74_08040 [Chryseobacterium daecheongense]